MITDNELNYWGDRYQVLDAKHELQLRHQLWFVHFLNIVRLNADNYRLINVYLNNPRWHKNKISLYHFLSTPDCAYGDITYPSATRFLPAKPCKNPLRTVTTLAKSLVDYWEQRLDDNCVQIHGNRPLLPTHKRNQLPIWRRAFSKPDEIMLIRAARYRRMGKNNLYHH